MLGKTRCERHGVLWQGIKKPTVMVESAREVGVVEFDCVR